MLYVALRRILGTLPALLGVSIVIFILLNALPGDPLAGLLAPDSSAADREALAESLGLNDPLPIQYVKWLWNVLQGDFGDSLSRSRPVAEVVGPAFQNTLGLATAAAVFGLLLGMVLGTIAALRPSSWLDRTVGVLSMTGLSIPSYWLGILLIIVFSTQLKLLPAAGMARSGSSVFKVIEHLILPALATSAISVGLTARTTRASLISAYGENFVLTLRAKGLRGWQILAHVWKNAAPAIMTVAGLQIGYLLGGSVLVEPIFSWPGLGTVIFQSISSRDLRVIQACVLVVAVTFVVINLVVDLLQMAVDPRLRKSY